MNRVPLRIRRSRGLAGLYALLLASGAAHGASLAQQIASLLNASPAARTAFWGIQIADLQSGRTLYSLNPERFFVPASNAKLFTAALALNRLGAAYTFNTRIVAAEAPGADGRVHGPITLIAGGDPNLSGRELPYRMGGAAGSPLAAIDGLAAQIAAKGVKRVGGIIADDSLFVWEPYPEGWSVDDPQYEFGAPVAAFSVNDNAQSITVTPGARAGEIAGLSLDPPVEFYQIDNRIRTVPVGGPRGVFFERDPGGLQLRLWGTIPLRDPGRILLVGIEDPARFAGMALRRSLSALGVAVEGPVEVRHLYRNEVPELSRGTRQPEAGGLELASRISAPLIDELRVMAKVSQNLHAEMLLRSVALARRGIGSREAGLEEMKAFLGDAEIDAGSYSLADAAGLTRLDLVTPSAMLRLLRFMYASPFREQWIEMLPVAGRDGTLSARFGDGAGAKRVFAKTGSLTGVAALSGYARRPNGGMAAFAIFVNNFNANQAEIRAIVDRIATLLVE
jgi:serine-type D-Ala-D-Ala carboxypeptidase/endopeptidase (penicillin-binding protein 4)